MSGWRDQVENAQSKEAYEAVLQVFHGLGRRMFDILHREHPEALQDSFIGLFKDLQGGMAYYQDSSGLTGEPAKHKMMYEATEALGIPTITPSDSAELTGKIADLITRLVRRAYDMQIRNVSRKPNTDISSQKTRKNLEADFDKFEMEIRQHEKFKAMLPIAAAIKTLAEQKDISKFAEKLFDPRKHEVTLPKQPKNEVSRQLRTMFPISKEDQRKEVYYDQLATDYLIEANANRGKKPS